MTPRAVDRAAHVAQLALTPILLLSGLAALFNMFSTRLGRISDQVDKLADAGPRALAHLRLRSKAPDIAMLLAALAGGRACAALLTLFVGEIRSAGADRLLFGLFGGALVGAIAALGAIRFEIILAVRDVRKRADGHDQRCLLGSEPSSRPVEQATPTLRDGHFAGREEPDGTG